MAEFGTAPWLLFDPVALSVCSVTAREGQWCFTVSPVLSAQRGSSVSQTHRPQHEVMALLPDVPHVMRWGCDGYIGLWHIVLLAAEYVRYLQA